MAEIRRQNAEARDNKIKYYAHLAPNSPLEVEDEWCDITTFELPTSYTLYNITLLKCDTSNYSKHNKFVVTSRSMRNDIYHFQASGAFAHLANHPLNPTLDMAYFGIHDPASCTCTTWRGDARSDRPVIQAPTHPQAEPNGFNSLQMPLGDGSFHYAHVQAITVAEQ